MELLASLRRDILISENINILHKKKDDELKNIKKKLDNHLINDLWNDYVEINKIIDLLESYIKSGYTTLNQLDKQNSQPHMMLVAQYGSYCQPVSSCHCVAGFLSSSDLQLGASFN